MWRRRQITAWAQRRLTPSAFALGVCALCFLLIIVFASRRRAPVVETVTNETANKTIPTPPAAVYFTPQLPARDADVELAGDKIAEATILLKKRQSVAALAALAQAEKAVNRAIERKRGEGTRSDALLLTLKELETAKRSVERGALADAHGRLLALDKRLDHLND